MLPLCFVLMPFGRKPDEQGRMIDFDDVYARLIAPGIIRAGLEPIRADQEVVGGTVHKPMFERLMLCDYAVADLTTSNPNVYYELGIRHALRPHTTVMVFRDGTRLPFDVALARGIPYQTEADDAEPFITALTGQLREARKAPVDSPLFQLLDDLPQPRLHHEKTDIFRDQVAYSRQIKDRLAVARRQEKNAVAAVDGILDGLMARHGDLADLEAGVVVDLYLSYRALKQPQRMLDLYDRMPEPLQRSRMIQEQRAFALNRLERSEEAEAVIQDVIAGRGPSPESNGILGRIYKDRWEKAKKDGPASKARGLLKQAVAAYLAGFECDWRDTYPGINAATLMTLADKPDPLAQEILPVVRYAAQQRLKQGGDYWDHATLLECCVLADDEDAAREALDGAAGRIRERWEPETTARNLRLIREARTARGEPVAWIGEIEEELQALAKEL